MSTSEAKVITKRFAELLKSKKFPLAAVYLFGSYARGNFHKWSDIDIAVVSKSKKYSEKRAMSLMFLRHEVDARIEPHYFSATEFKDDGSPLAYEVRRTGIKVA